MSGTRASGLFAAICAFLLFTGCGGERNSPDLGNWTLITDGLSLTEDLRISESEAFYFGRIIDLDVTSEGHMIAADWDATNIKVLRPDGTLIDTLGRSGSGPGEFQQLRSIQVARSDSIYAYDVQRSRLTVFAPPPSLAVVRTVTVSQEEGFATRMAVLDDRFVGSFGGSMTPEEGVRRPEPTPWRWIDASGTPGDTLMMARQRKRALLSVNGGFRIRSIPFGRETLTAIGPQSRLYYGWTDSLRISDRGAEGRSEVVASVPTKPIPVREADRDSALSDVSSDMKPLVSSALPDTKPALTDLVVADDGRLWVKRSQEKVGAHTTPWWVLDPDTKTIQEVRLPSEVDLEVVQNDRAYGTTETKMGAPAVVRYRIQTSS